LLNFPKKWKHELKGLYKTFNLYVKLPYAFYPDIKKAEKNTEEGNAKLKQLLKKTK